MARFICENCWHRGKEESLVKEDGSSLCPSCDSDAIAIIGLVPGSFDSEDEVTSEEIPLNRVPDSWDAPTTEEMEYPDNPEDVVRYFEGLMDPTSSMSDEMEED